MFHVPLYSFPSKLIVNNDQCLIKFVIIFAYLIPPVLSLHNAGLSPSPTSWRACQSSLSCKNKPKIELGAPNQSSLHGSGYTRQLMFLIAAEHG